MLSRSLEITYINRSVKAPYNLEATKTEAVTIEKGDWDLHKEGDWDLHKDNIGYRQHILCLGCKLYMLQDTI